MLPIINYDTPRNVECKVIIKILYIYIVQYTVRTVVLI